MFETERLEIRYLQAEDIPDMIAYRNKKEVAQYQSWRHYTKFEAKNRVRFVEKHPYTGKPRDNTQLAVIRKEDGQMIGDLHVEVVSHQTASIGYTIDSTYWHQGYGREAVGALLNYMRDHFPQNKVVAYIYPENDSSRRLLLDFGFKKFDESYFYHDEGYVLRLK